jgi:hypothetical protein
MSEVKDLENALGQYFLYALLLQKLEPERKLYLSVSNEVYTDFFHEKDLGGLVTESYNLSVLVFDEKEEKILKWIN